ncbi:MAG: hypothetical protein IK047_07220 [Clostridia bacterium]|nr:hypothetical protein [Clostridia bacterium]
MKEHIYTIPVNGAFKDHGDRCPFCKLYEKLERDELDLILGASMMEPEIRRLTNEKGFCERHFGMLLGSSNRLGLGLILESHLEELKKDIKAGGVFTRDVGAKSAGRIAELEKSCYICDRIEEKISKMFATAAYLYDEEKEFRAKFGELKYICLPHGKRWAAAAKEALSREGYAALAKALCDKNEKYLHSLKDDISLFCKKFDYRFDDLPWGESKDSIERSARFLKGDRVK